MEMQRLRKRKDIKGILLKFKNGEMKLNIACDMIEGVGTLDKSSIKLCPSCKSDNIISYTGFYSRDFPYHCGGCGHNF